MTAAFVLFSLVFTVFGFSSSYQSRTNDGVTFYPSIAYAKPPLGALRWKRAELESAARQKEKAISCLQFGSDSFPDEGVIQQEDCLYLNLFTPEKTAASSIGHPVLFWIHGGALLSGTGLKKFYNGGIFAKEGVIFVSPNYRLGELGFGPRLTKEPGSLGLMDLYTALQWVKKNIASFGGDPTRIYLMGHSKGAEAIVALMESGLADEDIKGGIALSGARHFDLGVGGKVPREPNSFWPGEQNLRGEEILKRVGYRVYNPELPSLRMSKESGPSFSLLVSSLYDESFLGQPSTMYCGMRMAALQFFDYVEASLLVLHPFAYEHGDELRSLFGQDRFGRSLLTLIVDFVLEKKSRPLPYKTSGQVTHLFPWFSKTSNDLWPEYASHFNCEGEAFPGTSKVSRGFQFLEKALKLIPFGQ